MKVISAGFEDEREFRRLLNRDDKEEDLGYNEGAACREPEPYMPIQAISDREVRVGPYNISTAVIAFLANPKLQKLEENRKK